MFLISDPFTDLQYEEISKRTRQIFPIICAGMIPVSFGMMLGWPSLAYPYLLQWDISPIPINLDQTALIAGFLMEGNSIGTLFCTSKFLNSKVAVFFCMCCQLFGWCVMFGANDIYGLLVSRMSVGFGNGYGTGQLKRYIKETCEPELAKNLGHYLPLGVNVGVILIYIGGAYVPFRIMAILGMVMILFGLLTFGIFPKKTLMEKKAVTTKDVLSDTPNLDVARIEASLNETKADESEDKQVNVFKCLKNTQNRNGLLLILVIVFVQQYTGGPANIVYSQIIFTTAGNPYPKVCSIIYAIFFLFSSIVSLKYARKFPRKANLLVSCMMCVIIIGLMALYYYVKHELVQMSELFSYLPLFILFLFNAFHTFGIATVPIYIMLEKIPKSGRNVATKFYVIHFSMSAVIATKIFQVLFSIFDMSMAYAFFVAVAFGGFVILWIFMDEYEFKDEDAKLKNVEERPNEIAVISRL